MIMDFAQNYVHKRQNEIHGAHWTQKQTTVHPIVVYYKCLEESCKQNVKEEVMCLSDDPRHDDFAVNSFIEKAIQHLKEKKVPIDRIIMWSDNAGPQYKSCKVFDTLSKMKIPVLRNYFGAKHGKSEADSAIG